MIISRQTTPHLLLVEDHADTARALTLLLQHDGYAVRAAASAAQALDLLEECTFDAVISDIGLPDHDGYELMQRIHERFGLRGVALSGSVDDEPGRVANAGFVEYLTKPVRFELLRGALLRIRGEV